MVSRSGEERAAQVAGDEGARGRSGVRPSATEGMSGEERAAQVAGEVPRVVLIGPPGAGKSTVGRLLAERWELDLVDTDAEVESATGRTISDIFVEDGEPAFRALEVEAVRAAVRRPGVLALGGGAPMQEPVQELITELPVVLLEVGIADASPRIGFDRSRPLLSVNPRAQWSRLMEQRRPTYARLADVVVDTSGRSADDVATAVAAALEDGAP